MRYCGNCGGSLDPVTLTERTCPWCGAAINSTGDIGSDDAWDGALQPTQAPASASEAEPLSALPTAPVYGFGIHDPQSMTIATPTHRSLQVRPIALLALVALALALVFGSALLLNNAPGRLLPSLPGFAAGGSQTTANPATTPPGAQPSPTPGSLSGGALASPGVISSPGMPTSTASPDGSPTPDGVTTETPTAGQPDLSVSRTEISLAVCLNSSAQFTVSNTGEGVMGWTATGSRSAYKFSPQSGALDGGKQQTVTVSGISASGSVTIDAPGASNTPQTVTISCTL